MQLLFLVNQSSKPESWFNLQLRGAKNSSGDLMSRRRRITDGRTVPVSQNHFYFYVSRKKKKSPRHQQESRRMRARFSMFFSVQLCIVCSCTYTGHHSWRCHLWESPAPPVIDVAITHTKCIALCVFVLDPGQQITRCAHIPPPRSHQIKTNLELWWKWPQRHFIKQSNIKQYNHSKFWGVFEWLKS